MSRSLQVLLLTKEADNSRTRRSIVVEIQDNDDVLKLKDKVASISGYDPNVLNIIFCGQALPIDLTLDKLLLSASTSLVATVSAEPIIRSPITTNHESEVQMNTGSYFVYCKKCCGLKQGKMRLYCSTCKSNAVLLKMEPNDWADIFDAGPVLADCQDCEAQCRVNFTFKCCDCDEISPILRHVKRNRYNRKCVVCDEITSQIVSLSCQHASCLDCFIAYLDNALEEWTLFRKPVGFTVACPMLDCNAYMEDIHHFHLLGIEKYRKYHKMAAEKFLGVLDERQYCPFPDCGAAFTVEFFENEHMVSCPECCHLYCSQCRSLDRCRCDDLVKDASTEVIKSISKPCPACGVPTERNGGCAHISCTQCRTDWCFICSKQWTTDCQWDHWFD